MTRILYLVGALLCLWTPLFGQNDLQRKIAEKQRAIDALEKRIAQGERELSSIQKGKNTEQQSVRRLARQIGACIAAGKGGERTCPDLSEISWRAVCARILQRVDEKEKERGEGRVY